MSTNLERTKSHDVIQKYILQLFEARGRFGRGGYQYELYGIESGKGKVIHPALMECSKKNNDYTARFIRHQPDKVVVINEKTYLVDIKSQIRTDTGNYTIERDSLRICLDMSQLGIAIILIFSSENTQSAQTEIDKLLKEKYLFKACLVSEMAQDINSYNRIQHPVGGSGTPGLLIPKSAPYLTDLITLLYRLEGRSKTVNFQTTV